MNMGEVCNREVVIIEKQASIIDAAKLMRDYHVGDVVVVEKEDKTRPVGILTDRDIVVELINYGTDLNSVNVGDVMSYELLTVTQDQSVMDTVKAMRTKGVRRVPVVDNKGSLIGIFTLDDVISLIAEQQVDLAALVAREQKNEEHKRR